MAKAGNKGSAKRGRGKAPSEPLPPEGSSQLSYKSALKFQPSQEFIEQVRAAGEVIKRIGQRYQQRPVDTARIDRAMAYRRGATPPEAATDPPTMPTTSKNPKRRKQRKSYWDDHVDCALRDKYPNNSAADFKPGEVVTKVLDVLGPEIKKSGRTPPSRGLILRKSGHWKT